MANSTATLGTVIANLKAKNTGSKVATLFKDKHAGTGIEAILRQVETMVSADYVIESLDSTPSPRPS